MLSQMKGFGPVTQNALLSICGDIDRCFDMDYAELVSMDKANLLGPKRIGSFVVQRQDNDLCSYAEKVFLSLEPSGTGVVLSGDDNYPDRFRNIKDMPVILYIKGNLRINEFEHSAGREGVQGQAGKMQLILRQL